MENQNNLEVLAIKNGKTYTVKKSVVWANLIFLIMMIIGIAIDKVIAPVIWKETIEHKIETVTREMHSHIDRKDIHPTFQERCEQFVPRPELGERLKAMNDKLDILLRRSN